MFKGSWLCLVLPNLKHKRKSNRGLFTANNLNKVFYDVEKSITLNVRQASNIRYYAGHSTSLQPVKNLKRLHRVMGRRFQGSLWSQFR